MQSYYRKCRRDKDTDSLAQTGIKADKTKSVFLFSLCAPLRERRIPSVS